ncbi:hypothetical protein XENOCAPTIV_027477 [Xenoophorus captivus]|uniref:Uncharacterized protein n=1 Tax=Xenoophorus captivus TaxID=1517983 RepID=A0ABV0RV98_9TELE
MSLVSAVPDLCLKHPFRPPVSSVVTLARRRSTLPSPCPPSSVSLWNILRNNIGKDLSKVAMPVQLNEPINTLQRLCEELEYSNLLDTANQTEDPYQRMVNDRNTYNEAFQIRNVWQTLLPRQNVTHTVYVATFAISAYASSYYRAGSKPFNPVLGETYECDRPDKGFRFIAEQVPSSFLIVLTQQFGDHYEWNKVTSCIHNILSGQRWIEHYGEMAIKNVNSDVCQCKVTFIKVRKYRRVSVCCSECLFKLQMNDSCDVLLVCSTVETNPVQ